MHARVRSILPILILLISTCLWAQEPTHSPEERLDALSGQAYGLEREPKENMLSEIGTMLAEESIDRANPLLLEVLAHVATESWATPVSRGGAVLNDFPSTRAHAARLLGELGTAEAQGKLLSILRRESNTIVLGEAARAIAGIPTDNRQPVIDILALRLHQVATSSRPEHAYAYALVQAVRILHDTTGTITDPDLFSALMAIAQGPYSGPIRELAIETVVTIRRSNTSGN